MAPDETRIRPGSIATPHRKEAATAIAIQWCEPTKAGPETGRLIDRPNRQQTALMHTERDVAATETGTQAVASTKERQRRETNESAAP